MKNTSVIISVTIFAATCLLFVLVLSGCATAPPKVVASPLVEIKPCISSPIPVRALLALIVETEQVKYSDNQGNEGLAVKMIVTPESLKGFFNYVEKLEEIVKHTSECVVK